MKTSREGDFGADSRVSFFTINKNNKTYYFAAKKLRKEYYTKSMAIAQYKLAQKLQELGTSINKLSFYKLVLREKENLLVSEDLSQAGRYKVTSLAIAKNLTESSIKTIARDAAICHNQGLIAPIDAWLVRTKGEKKKRS